MSEPFLAQIKIVGFNFAPRGWALCDGQLLPINQNQSLFSLLGTTYGGDGRTSFALPELRGRTPIHQGQDPGSVTAYELGAKGGTQTVTLTVAQIAVHTHAAIATGDAADNVTPTDRIFAKSTTNIYKNPVAANMTALRSGTVLNTGGGGAHNNMQPYLTLNFVIALKGLFPSRN